MARRSKFGRFQVWNQPSDAYKHTDLAYNYDVLDQMIGGDNALFGIGDDFNNPTTTAPGTTDQWLYPQDTTQITNFGNRTLYNIVRALDHNDVPLGAVFMWWRPSTDVPLPGGCVPADGSTYTGAAQHSYVPYGLTSITVPDLRNKMVLGAYETVTGSPTIPLNRDGLAATLPSVNTATAGPGIGAIAGTNVPLDLRHTHTAGFYIMPDHVHQMNDHVHDAGGHTHVHSHSHNVYIGHSHSISGTAFASTGAASANFAGGAAGNASGRSSTHTVSGGTSVDGGTVTTGDASPVTSSGASGNTGGMIPGTQWTDNAKDRFTHVGVSSITGTSGPASAAGLTSVEVLSRYVGLMFMVKIRKDGPLHNTAFTAGP